MPFIVVLFFSILEGYHKILQEINGRSQRRTDSTLVFVKSTLIAHIHDTIDI